jgi:hypothetical protein
MHYTVLNQGTLADFCVDSNDMNLSWLSYRTW